MGRIYSQDARVVQYSQIKKKIHKSINVIHHISKRKNKNNVIISINAEKAFDKVQHSFMIKTLNKVGLERIYINIIKTTYENPKLIPYSMGENQELFP